MDRKYNNHICTLEDKLNEKSSLSSSAMVLLHFGRPPVYNLMKRKIKFFFLEKKLNKKNRKKKVLGKKCKKKFSGLFCRQTCKIKKLRDPLKFRTG